MATFKNDYNGLNNAGVKRVKIGEKAPILEVELNEMQVSILEKNSRFLKNFVGNLISDKSAIIVSDTVVTIGNCFFIVNGEIIKCTGLTCTVPSGSTAYLNLREIEVDGTSLLREEGNEQGKTITNYLVDKRMGVETSHRIVTSYTLSTVKGENSIPIITNNDGVMNIVVSDFKDVYSPESLSIEDVELLYGSTIGSGGSSGGGVVATVEPITNGEITIVVGNS